MNLRAIIGKDISASGTKAEGKVLSLKADTNQVEWRDIGEITTASAVGQVLVSTGTGVGDNHWEGIGTLTDDITTAGSGTILAKSSHALVMLIGAGGGGGGGGAGAQALQSEYATGGGGGGGGGGNGDVILLQLSGLVVGSTSISYTVGAKGTGGVGGTGASGGVGNYGSSGTSGNDSTLTVEGITVHSKGGQYGHGGQGGAYGATMTITTATAATDRAALGSLEEGLVVESGHDDISVVSHMVGFSYNGVLARVVGIRKSQNTPCNVGTGGGSTLNGWPGGHSGSILDGTGTVVAGSAGGVGGINATHTSPVVGVGGTSPGLGGSGGGGGWRDYSGSASNGAHGGDGADGRLLILWGFSY